LKILGWLASAPLTAVSASSAPAATAVATPATAVAAAAATITAAAATVATAATSAAAAATGTRFARTRFVYRQGPALDGLAVELGDRFLRIGFIAHRDKSKAARFAGKFVLHESDFLDRAGLGEKILEVSFGRVEGKISYVEFGAHLSLFLVETLLGHCSRLSDFKSPLNKLT
jgi:hypothetical protein